MIYLCRVEGQNLVKIGYSENPKKRFLQLQVGMPHKLVPFAERNGSVALEAKIHKRLTHIRVTGEWYQDLEEVYDAFFHEEDPYPSCNTRTEMYKAQEREREAARSFASHQYMITKSGQVRRQDRKVS